MYRKYQYYQNHKISVDRYGVVTSKMLLTSEEVEKIMLFLLKNDIILSEDL